MEYMVPFLNYLEFEKRYSKRTIESYRIDLVQFTLYIQAIGEKDLLHVHFKTIRGWVIALLEEGCENRTVNRKISTLKSFYKYLLRQGLIDSNPLLKVESLKTRKQVPVFVTPEQTHQLLDETGFDNDFPGIRNKLIIELLYVSGMRLSELINLKTVDFDKVNLTLKVLGKRNKERIIPFTIETGKQIEAYLVLKGQLGFKNEYLLVSNKGEKLYSKFVYRLIHEALGMVSTLDKRSPHVLRHTFATHMLNNGAGINDIKELLGHSSLAATQVYTHSSFEKLKEIYKQAHPRA